MNNKDYITLYSTFAPAEAERRVVFHPLPQGKVVVGE